MGRFDLLEKALACLLPDHPFFDHWNARQIEILIYINALGFDYVDDQIVVYAQVLSFSTIAKQEAGGQRENTTSIVAKATGDTVVNALFKLYPTSQAVVDKIIK